MRPPAARPTPSRCKAALFRSPVGQSGLPASAGCVTSRLASYPVHSTHRFFNLVLRLQLPPRRRLSSFSHLLLNDRLRLRCSRGLEESKSRAVSCRRRALRTRSAGSRRRRCVGARRAGAERVTRLIMSFLVVSASNSGGRCHSEEAGADCQTRMSTSFSWFNRN